jgi:hypothetical protein
MATENIVLEPDEPPKSGVWVDTCDVLADPTQEEIDLGNALGVNIDTDNDDDPGSLIPIRSLLSSERDQALEKAKDLKVVMLDFGVPEVSIELQEGRPSSFGLWDALFCVSDMSHHTVSRYSSGSLTPVLGLCKRGRSDLPGPLCNGYGGWDLCYRIMTFGYANHPGEGGPKTVPALTAGTFTIPRDSARRYSWGTEWEGGLSSADWDRTLRNPRNGKSMTMREFMGRSNAALEEFHKIHPNAHLEHSTWTSRKIDRLGYTAAEGIAEKNRYKKIEKDWFDMATKEDLREVVDNALKAHVTPELLKDAVGKVEIPIDGDGNTWPLSKALRHIMAEQDRIKNKLNKLADTEEEV